MYCVYNSKTCVDRVVVYPGHHRLQLSGARKVAGVAGVPFEVAGAAAPTSSRKQA